MKTANTNNSINIKNLIFKNVLKTVNKYCMIRDNDCVLISISGGPDSVFLTHFFNLIKENFNLSLYCFHLDHMTRNGQSKSDADFVTNFCKALCIPLYKEVYDVKKIAKEKKLSFQDAARNLRLELLAKTANKIQEIKIKQLKKEIGQLKIAIGHNADDNIETFFMHLLRGAGLDGLSSIKPVDHDLLKPYIIIRPLIETFREDILNCLNQEEIPFCVDKSNLENIYFRNKIRNLLIPYIKENFSKNFAKKIIKTINIIREENKFLENILEKYLNEVLIEKKINGSFCINDGKNFSLIKLNLEKFSSFPEPIKKRILIYTISQIKGDKKNIKNESIERILSFCFPGGQSKFYNISKQIKVIKEQKELTILKINDLNINKLNKLNKLNKNKLEKSKDKILSSSLKESLVFCSEKYNKKDSFVELAEINEDQCGFEKKEIIISLPYESLHQKSFIIKYKIIFNCFEGGIEKIKKEDISLNEAFLDFYKIQFPVKMGILKKLEGQRFYPLGLEKPKKLHDFFIDLKIPKSKRKNILIFYDNSKIIWVGSLRIDNRVKVDKNTKKIFYIKIVKI